MVSGIRKKGRSCPLRDVCLPPEMGYPGLESSQAECRVFLRTREAGC